MMEKRNPEVKCEKIEGGCRIEVTGIDCQGGSSSCCMPIVLKCGDSGKDCCSQEEKQE